MMITWTAIDALCQFLIRTSIEQAMFPVYFTFPVMTFSPGNPLVEHGKRLEQARHDNKSRG